MNARFSPRTLVITTSIALLTLTACSTEPDDGVAGQAAGTAGAAAGMNAVAGAGMTSGVGGTSSTQAGAGATSGMGSVAGSSGGMSAMSGAGGSAGAAGTMAGDMDASTNEDASQDASEPDANVSIDESLIGWASVDALMVNGTTGGAGGETVTANNADDLMEYAAADEPLIIQITGTIAVPRLQVSSNKTLIGMGASAQINGGIRIRGSGENEEIENVIVRNLSINAASSDVDGDGVQIHYAHHVWVDHCEIWDAPDGNLDIVHASDYVTVSWSIFRYTNAAPDAQHRFSNLIGHDDPNDEDEGKLKVTFHHNLWSDGVIERMPRVRYGQVHVLNNVFDAPGNNYAIRGGYEADILIENNYFDGVSTPHEIDDGSAIISASGNEYPGTTGAKDTAGDAFDPPYPYTPQSASEARTSVLAGAGPQ